MQAEVTGARPAAALTSGPSHLVGRLRLVYVLVAAWITAMLFLGRLAPDDYRAVLQEDRAVEWGTTWLFLVAGLVRLRQAIGTRRLGDGLVALFCLFVAGEEISWGQRLLGFGAPAYFLAHNYQQEVTLHNLLQSIAQPKWFLAVALLSYGVLLPLVARTGRGRRLHCQVGATAPPLALAPLFVGAVGLLVWYPLTLTGEWVELLAGILLLAAAQPGPAAFWASLLLTLVVGPALTVGGDLVERRREPAYLACAAAEVEALLHDITAGEGATPALHRRSVHKRVWTAIADGYLDGAQLGSFVGAACGGAALAGERRRYGVDPWGTAYWLSVRRLTADQRQVVVYSFGPNRRRDGTASEPAGDDVAAVGLLETRPGRRAVP